MTNSPFDNPAGFYTNVPALKPVDIGTALNPLGVVYAQGIVADSVSGDSTLLFNNYLNAISSTGTSLDLIKGDATDNTVVNTPTGKVGKLAVNGTTVGTWDSNSIDFPAFNLMDGSDKNYTVSVLGAGTAYTLTATPAAVDLGTTDPVIVLNKAGTYLIRARVNIQNVGATYAANRTVTIQLNRTNNTPGVITGSATAFGTGVTTTVTGTMALVNLPDVIVTTANIDDAITIFASVSVIASAGTSTITEANIVAVRLY